jgi:nucleoside-diphosphate-sugar epimerase
MKNILITGGSGYIGSKLVPYLLEMGLSITVIDKMDFYNNLKPHPNLKVIYKDVLETQLNDYVGYDAIVHLAGLSNDPMANFSPNDNFVQNLAVTGMAAFLAKKAGIPKFIFAGSCSVYGNSIDTLCDESAKTLATFPYGVSKLQCEAALLQQADETFHVTVLRQATVFGWAPRMRTDLVVNTMTKTSILERKIHIHDASVFRPLIHIDDLCTAYFKVLQADNLPQIMNISGNNYSLNEIASQVKDSVYDRLGSVLIENKNLKDPRSYCVSNALMKQHLGSWDFMQISDGVKELLQKTDYTDVSYWSNPDWINLEMYIKNYKK